MGGRGKGGGEGVQAGLRESSKQLSEEETISNCYSTYKFLIVIHPNTNRACVLTFIQAASAAFSVFTTACMRFSAFLVSIISALTQNRQLVSLQPASDLQHFRSASFRPYNKQHT